MVGSSSFSFIPRHHRYGVGTLQAAHKVCVARFFGYDDETQTSRSSVPDDKNMARLQLLSDHLARGINLLTKYCREFADGNSEPLSFEERLR